MQLLKIALLVAISLGLSTAMDSQSDESASNDTSPSGNGTQGSVPFFRDLVLELPKDIEEATMKKMNELNLHARDVPSKICVKVKAVFNKPFRNQFASLKKAKQMIRRMFQRANKYYKYPGLSVRITFRLKGAPIFDRTNQAKRWNLRTNKWLYHDSLSKHSRNKKNIHHWAFFTSKRYPRLVNGATTGAAERGSTCAEDWYGNPRYRVSLMSWYGLDVTSSTLAHELGHALGMKHDFIDSNNPLANIPRYDSSGKICTNLRPPGVMDYENNPRQWSTCSNEDLLNFLNGNGACLKESTCQKTTKKPIKINKLYCKDYPNRTCLPGGNRCMRWAPPVNCQSIKWRGLCGQKLAQNRCRKTCGLCKRCKEANKWKCKQIKRNQRCSTWWNRQIYCPKTCGLCN